MIGLIITGHGNFATGIMSAVNLLAGKPEYFGLFINKYGYINQRMR